MPRHGSQDLRGSVRSRTSGRYPETVLPETVLPETVLPETVLPETVLPETVLPETVLPEIRRGGRCGQSGHGGC